MPPNIKVSEHWIVVKTSILSDGDKDSLIDAGFSHPFLKSGAENTGVLLRKKIEGETPPNDLAGLIALYSKPKPTDAVYGEISPADMAELEALIASLGLELKLNRGGKRKNKSRKSRKNKSRRSRKNKSRK